MFDERPLHLLPHRRHVLTHNDSTPQMAWKRRHHFQVSTHINDHLLIQDAA